MFKVVLILGLAAIASAQVLRISPVVPGSSSAGQVQVIQLARGGGVGSGAARLFQGPSVARVQPISFRPQSVRPIQVVQAAPQQLQLVRLVSAPQPQVIRVQAAPRPAINFAPQPSRSFASREDDSNSEPSPYAFSFDSEDEFGTKIGRQESADGSGTIRGQYTLSDANGISRVVVYVADDSGFHAEVKTNEAGTLTSNPADVQIQSTAGSQ